MLADDVYNETTSVPAEVPSDNEFGDDDVPKTRKRPDRTERRFRRYMLAFCCVIGVLGGFVAITVGGIFVAHADDTSHHGWGETLCTPLILSSTNASSGAACLYLIVETPTKVRACAIPAAIVRTRALGAAAACTDETERERARWPDPAQGGSAPVACLVPRTRTISEAQCHAAATSFDAYANLLASLGDARLVYLIDSPAQGHAALYAETNELRTIGALVLVLGLLVTVSAAAAGCWARIVNYFVHRPQQFRRDELRRRGNWKDAAD